MQKAGESEKVKGHRAEVKGHMATGTEGFWWNVNSAKVAGGAAF